MEITQNITIEITLNASVEKVWACWTQPEHITHWNFASAEWHCPWAKNDLRVGGTFTSRMEAKDGSFGFDFGGVYTTVRPNELIEYTLADYRRVYVHFISHGTQTTVVESFDCESQNSVDLQRNGWSAILQNFKKHVEETT